MSSHISSSGYSLGSVPDVTVPPVDGKVYLKLTDTLRTHVEHFEKLVVQLKSQILDGSLQSNSWLPAGQLKEVKALIENSIAEREPATVREKLLAILKLQVMHESPQESPSLAELREIIRITKIQMLRMNRSCPGLPPDSVERTLNLVTQPGSHTVILKGVIPSKTEPTVSILGYGIVVKGQENFPDLDHIPKALLERETACRVIRLFSTEEARELLPRGGAFTGIINEIKEIGGKGPVIGMVLTDIIPRTGNFDPSMSPDIWLEAKKALEMRGFEDTGSGLIEPITFRSGTEAEQKVDVSFRWYVWPPFSEQGRLAQDAYNDRISTLEQRKRQPLAWLSTLSIADTRFIYHGHASGAFDVADLFRASSVFGGVYPTPNEKRARSEKRANLRVQAADPEGIYMPAKSADVVLVYGILPDIAKRAGGSPQEMKAGVEKFIDNQVSQLRDGGHFLIRDTVSTEGPRRLFVEFDARVSNKLSTAALFRQFISEQIEPHISRADWDNVVPLQSYKDGKEKFLVPSSVLYEFCSKPYPKDWNVERQRPFAFITPTERRDLMTKAGLRLHFAGPEFNPWITETFYQDKISITNLGGTTIPLPPTNYITFAEKVEKGAGVELKEVSSLEVDNPKFVSIDCYHRIERNSGKVHQTYEVASRPNLTLDIEPFRFERDELIIIERVFRRPIVTSNQKFLDGSFVGAYFPEQIAAIVPSVELETDAALQKSALKILTERAGMESEPNLNFTKPMRYFTIVNTANEQVVAQPIQIESEFLNKTIDVQLGELSNKISIKKFKAIQILHNCQVGGLPEARSERMIYSILTDPEIRRSCGPWLGNKLDLATQECDSLPVVSASELISPPKRQVFEKREGLRYGFLAVHEGSFVERDAEGTVLGGMKLEYVTPGSDTGLSASSIPFIPLIKKSDGSSSDIYVGLEVRDFPAAQERTGSSALATIPTFRVPETIGAMPQAVGFLRERLGNEFGIALKSIAQLGGKYFPSPGITPEVMYPMFGEVDVASSDLKGLQWVPLHELVERASELQCGQAITAVFRAAHAQGLIK